MNHVEIQQQFEKSLDLLAESEVELDAWKDKWPDIAGNTPDLLKQIRAFLKLHRPEPNFDQHINQTHEK